MEERKYIRSHRQSWWSPSLAWITLVMSAFLFVNLAYASITCSSVIESLGATVPRGDIVIEYGSGTPLEITCVLDADNKKVQNMFRNDTTEGGEAKTPSQRIMFYKNSERVSRQYTTIINATAAQLRISNPPAGRDTFYCSLLLDDQLDQNHTYGNMSSAQLLSTPSSDSSTFTTPPPTSLETSGPPSLMSQTSEVGVCLNSVAVGYKPTTITNFSCISDNWVSLTCNWTKPDNPIKTAYRLFFRIPGRVGGRTMINCPKDSDSRENTCYWDLFTTPLYRKPYEYYYFILIGDNVLGNSTTSIRFHHYANIVPASPINITVVDKTQSSAILRWSVGKMTAFPQKLTHKIEYKSQWDSNPQHWHPVNVSDVCNSSSTSNRINSYSNCLERDTGYYYFNVTDLKYQNTQYDFRIYVRSSVALGEDKWSPPGCITLKTKPSIPRRPPRTDVGSFECVTSPVDKSKRDVFIYWQNIEDNEKCGDSFEYYAYYTSTTTDNKTIFYRSNKTYNNYAKFEGLSTDTGYNFTVYSSNKEGLSTEYSTIFVPNESDKLDEPLSFTKMAFDERGVFELSWKNYSSQKLLATNQVNDYTIFWCENDENSHNKYQCNGSINWMHIPGSELSYNIIVSDKLKNYQFAISANSQSTLKTGITIPYQSTSSSSGMVWVSCTVLSNKIVGKMKNVWVSVISSTSMELRWKLDCSDRIGAVLGFRIFYCPVVSINNFACKEPILNKTVSGEMARDSRGKATITELKSNTTYMVTIASITNHGEGLHSDPLINTTLEEAPDVQNLIINVTRLTNTTAALQWWSPKFSNSVVRYYHVDYYLDEILQQQDLIDSFDEPIIINEQHRITVHDTKCQLDHLESYRSYTITITACTTVCSERSHPIKVRTSIGPNVFHVPVQDCNDNQVRGLTISFAVRAVNNNPLDPHNPHYGQWSVPGSVSCELPAPAIENLIINVTRLTNTTLYLQWSPPKFTNGVVRYYHIDYYLDHTISQQHDLNDTYFDEQQVVNKQRRLTVYDTKCRLDHLESYTTYTIAITECTSVCTERSLPIKVRTAVGLPGRVSQLNVLKTRDGINVSWARPLKPAGPIDYYDLIIAHDSRPTNSQSTNGSSSSSTVLDSIQLQENMNSLIYQFIPSFKDKLHPHELLQRHNCNHKFWSQKKFLFAVRAVNRNPLDSESPYYGQWSVPRPVHVCSLGVEMRLWKSQQPLESLEQYL